MTSKEVKNFILTGEGYHTEFKQTLEKSVIDVVCAFANSSGGRILLGVTDKGAIKGIDTSNRMRSKIQDILRQLQPKLSRISVEIKNNLIVIRVPEGEEKPYGCSRGFFMRVGASSQKMTRNEIINFFKKESRVNFEELVNEKADLRKDFDSKSFKHFLKLSGISSAIKRETLLQNLDCLTLDKKLTNLGVLFFAKDIDFIMNYALVDCVLFRSTDKVKILDRKQYKGNLIENIENSLSFVQRHTNTEYIITGKPRREEIPDYPETALREAIVNAVCHRDYFERRCHVVIEVYSDRVEIYNPGGLPSGLDPKKFGTKSVPRNLLIASMLHRANYIEKAGTGIKRIKSALAKHKKKIKLKIQYDKMFYSVIFKKALSAKTTQKTTRKLNLVGMALSGKITQKNHLKKLPRKLLGRAPQEATQKTTQIRDNFGINPKKFRDNFGINPKKFQDKFGIKALHTAWFICKNPNINIKDIAKKLSVTERTVENYLSKLKANKYIIRDGSRKAGYWKIIKK